MRRIFGVGILLWLALILALVGSLRHVAWGFSTLEQGDIVAGYIQAVAVDLGLLALALGIQDRKRNSRGTLSLWLGVALFCAVSTYANLLHGLYFQTDLGLAEWQWLVFARPFVLSGVLPLLVVYLSEIVGADAGHANVVATSEELPAAQVVVQEPPKPRIADVLIAIADDGGEYNRADVARISGKSPQAVSSALAKLQGEKIIERQRNGDGKEKLVRL